MPHLKYYYNKKWDIFFGKFVKEEKCFNVFVLDEVVSSLKQMTP